VAENTVKVAVTRELPPGRIKVAMAQGRMIALFNVKGTIYAMDNECTHQGGPIGDGSLKGTVVSCPWHLWQFDVTSGKCLSNPFGHVRSYPVQVTGDEIWVTVASL
jgi:nitrite reductase/ring-hydroxylating ferredoxin subunit